MVFPRAEVRLLRVKVEFDGSDDLRRGIRREEFRNAEYMGQVSSRTIARKLHRLMPMHRRPCSPTSLPNNGDLVVRQTGGVSLNR